MDFFSAPHVLEKGMIFRLTVGYTLSPFFSKRDHRPDTGATKISSFGGLSGRKRRVQSPEKHFFAVPMREKTDGTSPKHPFVFKKAGFRTELAFFAAIFWKPAGKPPNFST
ncbi:MAG TPA: hypothetical protein PLU82_03845 [Oscillospiraceae bacterium]|nr:hypothetical protein [Oscillospiraceae bacterium]